MSICKQHFFSQCNGLQCIVLITKYYMFSMNLKIPVALWQVLSKYEAVSFCVLHHCATGSH
jgi:hypothetical protein